MFWIFNQNNFIDLLFFQKRVGTGTLLPITGVDVLLVARILISCLDKMLNKLVINSNSRIHQNVAIVLICNLIIKHEYHIGSKTWLSTRARLWRSEQRRYSGLVDLLCGHNDHIAVPNPRTPWSCPACAGVEIVFSPSGSTCSPPWTWSYHPCTWA